MSLQSIDARISKIERHANKGAVHTIFELRRKLLTDRAVLNGDQDALQELSVCRLAAIPGSREQRAAALASGLSADT